MFHKRGETFCYNLQVRTFYLLVANSFIATSTISMVWFALGLWAYVQTDSVLLTSIMYGIYMIANSVTGIWFGSIVDHKKKKTAMLGSSIITLATFIAGFLIYISFPDEVFKSVTSVPLWALILLVFAGVVVSNIRNIAMPTITTLLVPEDKRDKANGLTGTIFGLSFLIASIASGFLLASSGLFWIMIISMTLLTASIVHLVTVNIPEKKIVHVQTENPAKYDFLETLKVIRKVPGLFELILFTCFNNFLGGVFMPLLDPYGLSLVSVSVWGVLWGFLSLGFIFGGLFIAKFGLGKKSALVTLQNESHPVGCLHLLHDSAIYCSLDYRNVYLPLLDSIY